MSSRSFENCEHGEVAADVGFLFLFVVLTNQPTLHMGSGWVGRPLYPCLVRIWSCVQGHEATTA